MEEDVIVSIITFNIYWQLDNYKWLLVQHKRVFLFWYFAVYLCCAFDNNGLALLNDREPEVSDDNARSDERAIVIAWGYKNMYTDTLSFDILEMASKMPNAIFQISAGDLCEFAKQLIHSATDLAQLQLQRADLSKELLTIDEVVSMLKVSKMTLHRWDKSGILTKIEVGGQRRYRRADVEAITNNRKKK